MSVLCETYIFYADVYFIQNFIIKTTVIYLSLYCNKLHFLISTGKGLVKVLFAAALGTMFEIVSLWIGNDYNLLVLLIHLLEIPLMIAFVLGKEREQIVRVVIAGYFWVMVTNAVLELLWNYFGENGNYLFLICVSSGLVYVGIQIFHNYNKIQKGIFPVEIVHEGRRVFTYGFYDSGNQLREPYTGKGVHIISEKLLNKLMLEKELAVLVPYQALGNEDGMVNVYYVEELIIGTQKQRKSWKKCPLGVTKENLFKENKFEIILNEEVF